MKRVTRAPMIHLIAAFMMTSSFLGAQAKVRIPLATGEYAPYVSQSAEGKGFFVELLVVIFKEMGTEFECTFMPWPRGEALTQEGLYFATFPYLVTEERRKTFDFSDGVVFYRGRFFARKGGKVDPTFSWKTYNDLKPYVIGGVRGNWYEPEFKAAGLNVVYSYSEEVNLKALSQARVDLAAESESVGWHMILRIDPGHVDDYFTLAKPTSESELCLMVSRKYPGSAELLKTFNAALARARAKGAFAAILKKYRVK